MKILVVPLLLMLATLSSVESQTLQGSLFLTAGAGIGAHDNGPFSRRLQQYTPRRSNGEEFLYQSETISQVGYTFNAGAAMLLGSEYLFGVSGEILSFPEILIISPPGVEPDQYLLMGSGGGIDFGYLVVNEDAAIVYPYIHAGFYGYTLEYSNRQDEPIAFFEGKKVPAGTIATYTGAAPRVGIGVGLVKFIGSGEDGSLGLLIGARVGYGKMLYRPEWEQDGEVVNNGGHTPQYNALSLTLSIGLGVR